jgi:hypothetical protein
MPLLAGYAAASIQDRIATGPRAGQPVRRLRTAAAVVDGAKLRCARLEGKAERNNRYFTTEFYYGKEFKLSGERMGHVIGR